MILYHFNYTKYKSVNKINKQLSYKGFFIKDQIIEQYKAYNFYYDQRNY